MNYRIILQSGMSFEITDQQYQHMVRHSLFGQGFNGFVLPIFDDMPDSLKSAHSDNLVLQGTGVYTPPSPEEFKKEKEREAMAKISSNKAILDDVQKQ